GCAADDLGKDHARVASRTHECRAGNLAGETGPVLGLVLLQRLVDRAHGQGEVRARVAVGDRVHVQVVDPAAVRLDARAGACGELADEVSHALARTRWITTSTAATRNPVRRSTS